MTTPLPDAFLRLSGKRCLRIYNKIASMILAFVGLFASAFLSATLLPCQSELALAGMILAHEELVWAIVAAATVGNTLGSATNWALGRRIYRFKDRKWFPADPKKMAKAMDWHRKYGRWVLLLSWVPVIGDPITLVAGVLREPLWSFILVVFFAKLARYAVLAQIVCSRL